MMLNGEYWGQAKGFCSESPISFISFDIHLVENDLLRTIKAGTELVHHFPGVRTS